MKALKILFPIFMLLLLYTCGKPSKTVVTDDMSPEKAELAKRIAYLEERVADEPNNLDWRYELADAYIQNGEDPKALRVYREALDVDPNRSDLKFSYAELALKMGERKTAYQAYKEILQGSNGQQYLDRIAPKFMDLYEITPVIATSVPEAFASYSFDGNKIIYQAYQTDNWDIFEYDRLAQTTNQLTFNPAHEENPVYAPDMSMIAYTSTRDDHRDVDYNQKLRDIYIKNLSSDLEINLTTNSSNDWRPQFSPDGNFIVFVSERSDLRDVDFINLYSHIYIMESDGDFQLQLTNVEANDGGPCPSGGEFDPIYFDSNRFGTFAIFRMKGDGSEQKQLTFPQGYNDAAPILNRDKTKIVFFSDRDGNYEVYSMNIEGENQQKLTSNPADDLNPVYSPDGTKVLFHSDRGGNFDIYEMDLEKSTGSLPIYDVVALIDKALAGME
jgi:Tol biopolymer transport system component